MKWLTDSAKPTVKARQVGVVKYLKDKRELPMYE